MLYSSSVAKAAALHNTTLRHDAVFLGGAVLADIMKDKPSFWVSKQEYEEDPYRALKKCGSL